MLLERELRSRKWPSTSCFLESSRRLDWRELDESYDLFWPVILGTWLVWDRLLQCGSWSVKTAWWNCISQPRLTNSPNLRGGLPPTAQTHFGGARFITCHLRRLFLGNADRTWGIFVLTRSVWATALHLDPPKSRPCTILACGACDKYLLEHVWPGKLP